MKVKSKRQATARCAFGVSPLSAFHREKLPIVPINDPADKRVAEYDHGM
jgi:hypothetical protein